MVASFGIVFKVGIEKIGKEEDFQNNKHDEKFDRNDHPRLFAPVGHMGKSIFIKQKYLFK
jgi:hypothetical protein